MAITKADKAAAALERVRKAGSMAKREAKMRTGMIGGSVAAGLIGYMEGQGKMAKLGPLHASLIGLPMAFATSIGGQGAVTRALEAAAGPLVGVALYKLGKGEAVLGGE